MSKEEKIENRKVEAPFITEIKQNIALEIDLSNIKEEIFKQIIKEIEEKEKEKEKEVALTIKNMEASEYDTLRLENIKQNIKKCITKAKKIKFMEIKGISVLELWEPQENISLEELSIQDCNLNSYLEFEHILRICQKLQKVYLREVKPMLFGSVYWECNDTELKIYAGVKDLNSFVQELLEHVEVKNYEINIIMQEDKEIKDLLWTEKNLRNIASKQVNIILSNQYNMTQTAYERMRNIIHFEKIVKDKNYLEINQLDCTLKEENINQGENKQLIKLETIRNFQKLNIRKKTKLLLSKENKGEISKLNDRKKITEVIVPNISYLTPEVLEILEQKQNIEINFSDKNDVKQYGRQDDIVLVKRFLDKIGTYVNGIDLNEIDIKKFLTIYERIGEEIDYEIINNKKQQSENFTEEMNYAKQFAQGLLKDKTIEGGYAYILKLALSLVNIESDYIVGEVLDRLSVGGHAWNQVKLKDENQEEHWYNVDLSRDVEFIRKGVELKYCLKSNQEMAKTHLAKNTLHECEKTVSSQMINYYLQKEVGKQEEIMIEEKAKQRKSFLERIKQLLRRLTHLNKKQILALPQGKPEEQEMNNIQISNSGKGVYYKKGKTKV